MFLGFLFIFAFTYLKKIAYKVTILSFDHESNGRIFYINIDDDKAEISP